MSIFQSNQWLDAGESEEDLERGYDSEAHEESRGAHSTKRKRVEHDEDESDEESETEYRRGENHEYQVNQDDVNIRPNELADELEDHATFQGPARTLNLLAFSSNHAQLPGRSLKESVRRDPHLPPPTAKTGVLYMSRVPPFLRPSALRTLLTPHAPHGGICRIFLTPEDDESFKQRKRNKGSKRRSYVDGWLEFASKRDAKAAADLLNARTIGSGIGRGGVYKDDIWNLKYLKGFKWHHLVEQIRNESAERAARMRAEIGQATRENKTFTRAVEMAKMEKTREAKKKRRRDKDADDGIDVNGDGSGEEVVSGAKLGPKMSFKQHAVRDKETRFQGSATSNKEEPSEDVSRVLGKIF